MKNVKAIIINRVEGYAEDIMEIKVKSWEAAEKAIMLMAQSAPPKGEGYDKADFIATWEDGQSYKCRVDLQKEYEGGYDARERIKGGIRWSVECGTVEAAEAERFIKEYIEE